MKRSRLLWGAAALVAGLLTPVAVALPAQAVVPITVVTATSPSNSEAVKTITVTCPTGRFLYGAGGSIVSGAGSVSLEAVVPEGNNPGGPPTRAVVRAGELLTFSGSWSVSATATCGVSTTGLRVFSTAPGTSTETTKERNLSCPTGQALYGTGFRLSGGGGNAVVHDVIPGVSFAPRSLTVRATARPGAIPNWGLEAFAVCANPATTMRIQQAVGALDSNTPKSVSGLCPSGTVAHGAGAQTLSQNPGTAVDGRIALNTMSNLSSTTGTAAAAEHGTVTNDWRVQVYVICST